MIKCYETIGEPVLGGDYSKQKIQCFTAGKEVTLTAQCNGVVVCSDWKKCRYHMKKGFHHCPVIVAEAVLISRRRRGGGRKLRFIK